jgi:hypothetical protein
MASWRHTVGRSDYRLQNTREILWQTRNVEQTRLLGPTLADSFGRLSISRFDFRILSDIADSQSLSCIMQV